MMRCVNAKYGHSLPFHQAASGRPIAFGYFDPSEVDSITKQWLPTSTIQSKLDALERDLASNCGR